jgi:hypothetical protein
LARLARRLSLDWQTRYGHPIYLLQTFVQHERFEATCYQAANWHRVGTTQGRSRQDRDQSLRVPVKDIYLCPLHPNWRARLTDAYP